ncbi:MAG: DNA-binding proteins Bright/BRCAA1/RBP1 and proteins containing BRIGHT domain [Candelina submexicana]|nr:MAG: DNA-binding proteins Bright/BRCAA1/RBP1 and proteins containing BRIGHT domain [Candelina submexicana]
MASTNNQSSIAIALAGKTASVDIPKPHEDGLFASRDNLGAVAAKSLPPPMHGNMLPTPPNSISPSLPPQRLKLKAAALSSSPPTPVHLDSDIDLQDAVDHAKSQDQPQHGPTKSSMNDGPPSFEATGAITPGLLAKHHLPEILLAHGPLAIRHVMGYLTTSVPGFSGIPPAKARRLVVGALEGRGSGGEGGGVNGDVTFEKVGWGRWDANLSGRQIRANRIKEHAHTPTEASSPPIDRSCSSTGGLRIPTGARPADRSRRLHSPRSWAEDSILYSHDEDTELNDQEDVTMLEHEADKMSMDWSKSCSSSEAPDEGVVLDEDLGDETDKEDWATIGAAALRQGFHPTSGGGRRNISAPVFSRDRGGGRTSSALAKSMPMAHNNYRAHQYTSFSHLDGLGVGSDSQEREAIEALVRLSSV